MLDDRRKLAEEVNGVKGAGGSRESVMGEEMNCWRKRAEGGRNSSLDVPWMCLLQKVLQGRKIQFWHPKFT